MEMDAASAFALSVAIDRAVPSAVVSAIEVERLKTALRVSEQEHQALLTAECERKMRIEQALEGLEQGVHPLRILFRVLHIIACS